MKTDENIAEILGEKASFYLDRVCEKIRTEKKTRQLQLKMPLNCRRHLLL